MLPRDRWQLIGAFLAIVFISIGLTIFFDYRIDQAEKRITANTEKTVIARANIVALRAANRVQQEQIRENAKTAFALCDAAAGARDFWIKVRASTRLLLTDPTLTPIQRKSNEMFERDLTAVIQAAHLVSRRCD